MNRYEQVCGDSINRLDCYIEITAGFDLPVMPPEGAVSYQVKGVFEVRFFDAEGYEVLDAGEQEYDSWMKELANPTLVAGACRKCRNIAWVKSTDDKLYCCFCYQPQNAI